MWIIDKPIVNLITVLEVIKCQVFWCFKNTFFLNNCTLTIHVRSLVDWWQNLNHTQTKTFSTCYCHANFYHTSTKQNTFLIFIVSKVGDSTDFRVLLVIMIYIQIEKVEKFVLYQPLLAKWAAWKLTKSCLFGTPLNFALDLFSINMYPCLFWYPITFLEA